MSMAANIVLLADKGEPDWAADTKYYNNPVDPNDADGVAVDANGSVCVAVSGSPGFGFHCYNKYAGLRQIRLNNGITVSGGGTYSPDGTFVTFPDGSVKVFYTPTFDDPGGINAWQVFNVFDVDPSDGSLTTFAYGRDSNIDYNDGGYTQMTSGAGDSSGNFYGCGYTRRSGNNEYPYLVKYNSSGTVQWTLVLQPQVQQFTGAGVDTANYGSQASVSADSSGNTYVSLRHTTNSAIPTFTFKLMKFDSSGVQQWVRVTDVLRNGVTDGTYLYSADNPTSSTVRVVATDVSDGSIAWERTFTVTGNTVAVRKVFVSGGYVYVSTETTNGATNNTNNLGATWIKISTSGTLQWNRHVYASGSVYTTNFFSAFSASTIVGSKMYSVFKGLGGLTTVKLPLDGSKTGTLTTFPYLIFGGAAPFTYTSYTTDIKVDSLTISEATTSTATSTSSTYGTTTTTLTTADVDVLSLGVSYNASQIPSYLAPDNDQNPVITYSKRQLL